MLHNVRVTRDTDETEDSLDPGCETDQRFRAQYLNTLLTSSGATRSGHRVRSFSFIATNFAQREPGPAGTSLDFIAKTFFERRIGSIGGP